MPRPTGPWKVPERLERWIIDEISDGRIRTLKDFATSVLEGGYEESGAISITEQKLVDSENQLADFLALTNQELAALNNDINTTRRDRNSVSQERAQGVKGRLQSLLVKAQAFTPPSAEHRDFADYLVSKMETAIEAIDIPDTPDNVPLPQFIAQRTAQLEADVAQQLLAGETAADVQWVKDLLNSL